MFDIYAVGITSGWRKANKTFFGIVISLYFFEWSWNNGVCYLKESFFLQKNLKKFYKSEIL